MKDQIGNGSMPLRIGNLIDTTVYGGPYRDVPQYFYGVKMAIEIDHPHMVSVPTRDFDVPKVSDLQAGIVKALMGMMNDENVYVGCMGGIGRTGIFLAALAKVQIEYRKVKHRAGRGEDPVLYVRKHFIPHAVETQQQMEYIADFDVSDIVSWLDSTQTAMGRGGMTPARTRYITELEPIGEPDIDEYEYPDTDSADESTEEDAQRLQFESLQNQIDELREDADAAYEYQKQLSKTIDDRFQAVCKAFRAMYQLRKGLTNASLYERIRSGNWFNK